MYLIFDTETTGLPKRWNAPVTEVDNWPRCVQLAWQLHDGLGNLIEQQDFLIQPEGYDIPYDAEQIHGISTELASKDGIPLAEALKLFKEVLDKTQFLVGQNVGFDINIMGAEFYRSGIENSLSTLPVLDTCTENTASLCQIPGGRGGKFKLPTLTELHEFLFNEPFSEAHNAAADVEATSRCFFELVRRRSFSREELKVQPDYFEAFIKLHPTEIAPLGLTHRNLKKASKALKRKQEVSTPEISEEEIKANIKSLEDTTFVHLHNHSQFSVLQSTIKIRDLVASAAEHNMPAVALTDHANMMGAFHFVKEVKAYNASLKSKKAKAEEAGEDFRQQKILPIIGCEFFVCEDHLNKNQKDYGYQMVFLAKNKNGYHNLAKMASLAYTDGFYYVPRIDKTIVEQYKEDLIVLTGNLYGEIASKILNLGEKQAEEALVWWHNMFGEDLYVELMRHDQEDENRANPVLLAMAQKYEIKVIASNNTYYCKKEDAEAHDILLCVKDGEKQATPIGRGRGYRYGLPNQEYYFKSTEEMKALFQDIPEAILNLREIVDKIEPFELAREVLLPKFEIPEEFSVTEDEEDGGKRGENAYLRHITYMGAEKRYSDL
ncbi:MAG: PHP domain-containing protein, partial [Eudoraea sp.]|nr:PHP domain-containing protein [Eudoraea sp.]